MNFIKQKEAPPGGLEPPTFRLTAERASQLRHGGKLMLQNGKHHDGLLLTNFQVWESISCP